MRLVQFAPLLLALALPAHAADTPSTKLIAGIEGAYRVQSQNTIKINGKATEKYVADDVIEIVRHDDTHVYVHATLPSGTGHRCTVKGIASYEGGAFVYRDPEPLLSGDQCTLKLSLKGETLQLSDRLKPKGASTCRAQCGARSNMVEYTIPTSKRLPIKQVPKFKATKDYVQAVKAFEEMQR